MGIYIKREFWRVIILYAPRMEISEEVRDSFGKEFRGCIETCEDRGKVLVIEDMNARVGGSEV